MKNNLTSHLLNDWYLFPKGQAFIREENAIVEIMSDKFLSAIEKGLEVLPVLKEMDNMTIDDATRYVACSASEFTLVMVTQVVPGGIYAEVQKRGIKKALPKRTMWFPFGEYTPERFRFLCWNGYDVFGWIKTGKAISGTEAWNKASIAHREWAAKALSKKAPIETGCPFDEPLPEFDHNQHENHDIG